MWKKTTFSNFLFHFGLKDGVNVERPQQHCYPLLMTAKQKVIKAVQALPNNASIEDAMERLLFLAKVEKGIQQADSNQTLSHYEVREKMAKWLK
jgi:hypothetical protein